MRITGEIHLIKIDFNVQITPDRILPRFVNSIIVFGDYITVFDSGVKESYRDIYNYIELQNRKTSEIRFLILSHSHPDHIGSADRIRSDTGCRVLGHQLEKEWIENIDIQHAERPVPGFYNLVDRPVVVDEILTGDENLSLGNNIEISIINTPGHSKGSFCILFKNQSVLFTADSIPLPSDIPTYDDYRRSVESLDIIESMKDKYSILLSSWAEPVTGREGILKVISDGKNYLKKIDHCVRKHYNNNINSMENCKNVIDELGLPPLFITPLVDRAFRTHL